MTRAVVAKVRAELLDDVEQHEPPSAAAAADGPPFVIRWRDAFEAQPVRCPECRSADCARAMSPLRRHVLNVLSRSARTDGHARSRWPSTATLGARTGMSRRAVESHIRAAERAGWIRRDRRSRRAPVEYTLLLSPGATCDATRVDTPRTDSARVDTPRTDSSGYAGDSRVEQLLPIDGSTEEEIAIREKLSHAHEGAGARTHEDDGERPWE